MLFRDHNCGPFIFYNLRLIDYLDYLKKKLEKYGGNKMIGLIITLIGGGIAGWVLRGKVDKKSEYPTSGRDIDLEE